MKKLDRNQKIFLGVAVAGIAIYLLYRYYQGQQAASAATTMAPAQTEPGYAALAGQEQGDMASLQRQILGLTHEERALEKEIRYLGAGLKKVDRTQTVQVKKGSKLYNYYKKVTGHAPPASLSTSNFIYEAFLAKIPVRKLEELLKKPHKPEHPGGHPGDGPHGGKRNHPNHHSHVHHPNHGHQQRTGEHHRHGHHNPKSSGGGNQAPGHSSGQPHNNKGTHRSGARR